MSSAIWKAFLVSLLFKGVAPFVEDLRRIISLWSLSLSPTRTQNTQMLVNLLVWNVGRRRKSALLLRYIAEVRKASRVSINM